MFAISLLLLPFSRQKRDLKGFAETRRQQLTLKPNNRNNWIGFAVSHHLNKNYEMAINILDAYINTLESDRKPNYEDSEMMLYKHQILVESGELAEAAKCLDDNEKWIVSESAFPFEREFSDATHNVIPFPA